MCKVRRFPAVRGYVLGNIFACTGCSVSSVTGPQGNTGYIQLLPIIAAPERRNSDDANVEPQNQTVSIPLGRPQAHLLFIWRNRGLFYTFYAMNDFSSMCSKLNKSVFSKIAYIQQA